MDEGKPSMTDVGSISIKLDEPLCSRVVRRGLASKEADPSKLVANSVVSITGIDANKLALSPDDIATVLVVLVICLVTGESDSLVNT